MLNNTYTDCRFNVMGVQKLTEAEAEMRDHCIRGHRTKLKLQGGKPCHNCVTAVMQALRYKRGGALDKPDMGKTAMGGDTIDYKTEDVNGHRYGADWVMLKSQFAVLHMLKYKTASATAKSFLNAKAYIEALADPGCVKGFKIQRCGRDPGTEYLAEFLDVCAEHNIPKETGAVDVHWNQSIQENRHKMTHRTSVAMLATCCKSTQEELADLMHGDVAVWACECINHSEITPYQKEHNVTAFEELTADSHIEQTSAQFFENTPQFGEQIYAFVPLKKRPVSIKGKHAWRAVRMLFAGKDSTIRNAIKGIPYEKQGDDWALYPTLGGITKYLLVQGKFPLLEDEDYEGETMSNKKAWGKIFKAVGAQAKQWANQDELEAIIEELRISIDQTEEEVEEGAPSEWTEKNTEPEVIVNHGYTEEKGIRKIKFRVQWKGFEDPTDQTWHQMKDLGKCQKLIEDYMLNEELEPDDLIDQCVASVEDAIAEADDDDGFDEEHTVFLPTPKDDEETVAEAPAYRFGHMIDYDLKGKVRAKIENLTAQCQAVMPDIDMHFGVEQLMEDCDKAYQTDCEAMMTELDWATNNYAMGAEEIPLDEWMSADLHEAGLAADNREMEMVRRLRLRDATAEELKGYTTKQLQKCLEMRMCHTRKRPTPEQLEAALLGSLKSRFVAKDLKIWNKESIANTHAEVPGMIAWRLIIARADLSRRRQSSTDYDVAFMQAFTFADLQMADVLVRWYDYRTKKMQYGFLEGPTYGMQVCMKIWKLTHGEHLKKLGFKEACNQRAVYYHAELDIVIICHVDDPWIDVGLGAENEHLTDQVAVDMVLLTKEDAIHAALTERFATKGKRCLRTGQSPLDYLSMVCTTKDNKRIQISMDDYRKEVIEAFDMTDCKPAATPITKELLKEVTVDVEAGKYLDQDGIRNYQKAIGMFNWDVQTIAVDRCLAVSLSGKYCAAPVEACEALVKHHVRYIAGTIGQRLMNRPDSTNTLVVTSDSDLGGMHSITGDLRSRGCGTCMYKDMIVDFWSSWIGVHNSSGSAETYTLSQVLRRAMHVKYVGEEMGLIMPKIITVYVDATVAIAFAADVGNPTGMQFNDLREGWVVEMRNKSICKAVKVATEDNPSDFGTKILSTAEFKRQRRRFLRTPRYSRSKTIKGDLDKLQCLQVGSVTNGNEDAVSKSMGIMQMWSGYGAAI